MCTRFPLSAFFRCPNQAGCWPFGCPECEHVCVCVCAGECQSIKARRAPCDNTGTDSGVWQEWKYPPFPSSCSEMDASVLCIKGSSSCKAREPWSLWLSLCEKLTKQSPTRSELFFLKDDVLFWLLFKRHSLLSSGSGRSKTSTTGGVSAPARRRTQVTNPRGGLAMKPLASWGWKPALPRFPQQPRLTLVTSVDLSSGCLTPKARLQLRKPKAWKSPLNIKNFMGSHGIFTLFLVSFAGEKHVWWQALLWQRSPFEITL